MDTTHEEDRGTPVGRRVVLGLLGLGAAGVAAGPFLQRLESGLAERDPSGLTGLLPGNNGFRYYSVVTSVPERDATNYTLTVDGLGQGRGSSGSHTSRSAVADQATSPWP
ncbi:hypothetical protein KAURM247S_04779 [Kitasatospora aureofaciens]